MTLTMRILRSTGIMSIVLHSNMFHSPVWPVCYPEGKTARMYQGFKAADYLIRHQVESGHSFGVFDLEYQFKREESKATGGKLCWDLLDTAMGPDELLDGMDFPLVSIAMTYDGVNVLDMEKMGPLIECLPLFGTAYHIFGERDLRDDSWKPNRTKSSSHAQRSKHQA